jgi:hypothetical protein
MSEFETEIDKWLQHIIATEKPSAEISAFRFSLSEVEEGYLLCLAGSKEHDEADDAWATAPPDYLAEQEIIVSENEVGEWHFMLLQVLHFLGKALRRAPVQLSFLGGDTPVYTGFVDGDLYRLK